MHLITNEKDRTTKMKLQKNQFFNYYNMHSKSVFVEVCKYHLHEQPETKPELKARLKNEDVESKDSAFTLKFLLAEAVKVERLIWINNYKKKLNYHLKHGEIEKMIPADGNTIIHPR